MKQPEKYYCDICGKEIIFDEDGFIQKRVDVITDCEWTEGHPQKPHIEHHDIDICIDCYMKSIGFICGFRGAELKLRHNSEDTE